MYWTDLPCNELMRRVFSTPPEVGYIDLFDIEMKRDGPTITINFDIIDTLPDKPPEKWGKDFNRCRIGLYCAGVTGVSISGISTSMPAKIEFYLREGNNRVIINGNDFSIDFMCQHIHLTGPSVYLSK